MLSFPCRTSAMRSCFAGTPGRGSAQAHNHVSEFEDQDDFDNAICKLHRERNQTLLKLVKVDRASYLKHDSYGHPLPDRTKVMIFFRQARIPGHLENHIMALTNGSRNFSDLLEAIQMGSSSYPFFDNDWADGADVTECHDMDDHHDVDDDDYHVS